MVIGLKNLHQLQSNLLTLHANSGQLLTLDYSMGNLMAHVSFSLEEKDDDSINSIYLSLKYEEEVLINSKETPCAEKMERTPFEYVIISLIDNLNYGVPIHLAVLTKST